MEENNYNDIIGWCSWCKDEIRKGEKYVVDEEGELLHKDCDDQKNRYYDPCEG